MERESWRWQPGGGGVGLELGLLAGGGAGTMLIGAGQEAPAPAPATPQHRVAAPWPHGGGEDVGEGMLGAVFPFWPLQGGDLEGEMNF